MRDVNVWKPVIERVCLWTGAVVLISGAAAIAICAFWLVAETLLSVEDRICRIFKVQKPMVNYLVHHALYERLMVEHKSKLKAAQEQI